MPRKRKEHHTHPHSVQLSQAPVLPSIPGYSDPTDCRRCVRSRPSMPIFADDFPPSMILLSHANYANVRSLRTESAGAGNVHRSLRGGRGYWTGTSAYRNFLLILSRANLRNGPGRRSSVVPFVHGACGTLMETSIPPHSRSALNPVYLFIVGSSWREGYARTRGGLSAGV